MCQLLGMNANTPTDVMFSFTGFATRAEEHKDGFGIAFFEDKGVRLFVDTYERARVAGRRDGAALPDPQREHRRPHPQGDAGPRRRWRTRTRSCASSGAATGCSRTTAT